MLASDEGEHRAVFMPLGPGADEDTLGGFNGTWSLISPVLALGGCWERMLPGNL